MAVEAFGGETLLLLSDAGIIGFVSELCLTVSIGVGGLAPDSFSGICGDEADLSVSFAFDAELEAEIGGRFGVPAVVPEAEEPALVVAELLSLDEEAELPEMFLTMLLTARVVSIPGSLL